MVETPVVEELPPPVAPEVAQGLLARLNRLQELESSGEVEPQSLRYDQLEAWQDHHPERNLLDAPTFDPAPAVHSPQPSTPLSTPVSPTAVEPAPVGSQNPLAAPTIMNAPAQAAPEGVPVRTPDSVQRAGTPLTPPAVQPTQEPPRHNVNTPAEAAPAVPAAPATAPTPEVSAVNTPARSEEQATSEAHPTPTVPLATAPVEAPVGGGSLRAEEAERAELKALLQSATDLPVSLPRRPRPVPLKAPVVETPVVEELSPPVAPEVAQGLLARLNRLQELESSGEVEPQSLRYDQLEAWQDHHPERNLLDAPTFDPAPAVHSPQPPTVAPAPTLPVPVVQATSVPVPTAPSTLNAGVPTAVPVPPAAPLAAPAAGQPARAVPVAPTALQRAAVTTPPSVNNQEPHQSAQAHLALSPEGLAVEPGESPVVASEAAAVSTVVMPTPVVAPAAEVTLTQPDGVATPVEAPVGGGACARRKRSGRN
ncbi:hypothetical protein Deima_3027 [Deinococcus maricopensis DSM 21211]|uniref:Uncharacterized protein n=1 Tax=Deinococcus maricopensis (strain DSM 21211 / LMG 22137 / NRRL B-23946 / LB-34) TaxID=709986 RepID=E8U3N2_DEIML|nr:hypothetical protein Deima_3027 [Deinococcus maricopensis DSM 21211]